MTAGLWLWRFADEAGGVLDRPLSPSFSSRFDAEAWLGEHWRQLSAQLVASAQLIGAGDPVGRPVVLRHG